MSPEEFAAGHVFFRAGDAADCAYELHAGQVELLADANGATTCVRRFGPGDVFGEMALVEERPRAFTARAVTAGRAVPMTRVAFEHLLGHDPARIRLYLQTLFERLRLLTAASVGHPELRPATRNEADVQSASPMPAEFPATAGTTSDWVVVIHPLTHKAAETLPEEGLVVARFPLRIGRASGVEEPEALDLNDLWLLDEKPYQVSRNHCEIDVDGAGPFVRDRGSHLGCVVNDERIGGRSPAGEARLDAGDSVLVVGARMSKYQFRVAVSRR
jgi:hypothetical protein